MLMMRFLLVATLVAATAVCQVKTTSPDGLDDVAVKTGPKDRGQEGLAVKTDPPVESGDADVVLAVRVAPPRQVLV